MGSHVTKVPCVLVVLTTQAAAAFTPSARHGDASLSLMPENSEDNGVGTDHVARNASAPVDSTLSHPGRGSGVQPTARCDLHGGAVLPKHHELRHARARAGQLAMARGATTPSASARSAG